MTERHHQLPPELSPPDPIMEAEALRHVVTELTGKIQLLVEWMDGRGLLDDHCFTFPDGDVWKAQDVEPGMLTVEEANARLRAIDKSDKV